MGQSDSFEKKKLVIGIIAAPDWERAMVYRVLEEHFGRIDYTSRLIPFSYTDYYRSEMGEDLERLFVSFRDLVSPQRLSRIKLETNSLETQFADPERGNRTVNLDPGLLDLSRLILATTKDNAHRIPLFDGIYGEITLLYRKGRFIHLDWTYPDYRTPEYQEILLEVRTIYKNNLKQG